MSVGSDVGICLEDNGEGLIADTDCISCMHPPKQGCADGYIMHDVPLNNSCNKIMCTSFRSILHHHIELERLYLVS